MKAPAKYVLVTAAYNEERYISRLIESVAAQTHKPDPWVIVSDASTDATDDIVSQYAKRHCFVHLYRITEDHPRNFVAQVHAINAGFQRLDGVESDFIGNLDSDVTLEPTYFADLLARFHRNSRLGLAGGYIHEMERGAFQPRRTNSRLSVAHAVQLFRRKCFEEIGRAYVPLPYGGPDWHAEVNARLHGWTVESFRDLKVYHHRPTGAAAGLFKSAYRDGLMDHSLGSHPLFELFRVARRLRQRPYVLGGIVRLWAFASASAREASRPVSDDFVQFLRSYELNHLRRSFGL